MLKLIENNIKTKEIFSKKLIKIRENTEKLFYYLNLLYITEIIFLTLINYNQHNCLVDYFKIVKI